MDIIKNKQVRSGNTLDIVLFGTEITNEQSEKAVVSEKFCPADDSEAWLNAGDTVDYKVTPATEEDPRTYFSHESLKYVTEKNTVITGNTIEINSIHMNQILWQVLYQTDRLEAGKKVTPFKKNEFGEKVWARITKYDSKQNQLMVLKVAATLKVEIPQENNKFMTPKVTLEVIDSPLNELDPGEAISFPAAAGA